MAENKGIMLAKSVQKHAGRAKEKILQNLGKVDRTADEIFDDHLNNFNRQQLHANRLQKEFNSYIRCIRAAQLASKSLMDAVCEIYEPHWSGYETLQAQVQSSESLWLDFAHKLADQVLIPLNTYTGQFPEMKKKVEKRNRKLIDYDGQRHSYQNLQANSNKRKDEVKLNKGREQLEEARRTYELLNTELHDELPALYESRILFLVTNLQTLFATEQVFHNETAKIYSELEAIVDKLATESQRGSNTLRKQAQAILASSPMPMPVKELNNANIANSNQYQNTNGSANPPSPSCSTPEPRLDNVSPTPETAAAAVGAGAALPLPDTPTSTPLAAAPTAMARTKDSSSVGNLVSDATAVETPLSSPNANTIRKDVAQELASDSAKIAEEEPPMRKEQRSLSPVTNGNDSKAAATTNGNANHSNEEATTATLTRTSEAAAATTTTNGTAEVTSSSTTTNGNGPPATPDKAIVSTTATATDSNTVTSSSSATTASNTDESNNKKKELDATTTDLPPGVLYRVKATYGYVKEDVDELNFEVGDIIRVIEYDDPEDQEEGWLMGEKETTGEKGLFPANFTRPL